MDVSGKLKFYDFSGKEHPLAVLPNTSQSQYVRKYLSGLQAQSVIEEPCYFDRDYLDEFSAFYARSSQGYKNVCSRAHYFGPENVSEEDFELALGNDDGAVDKLQRNYLGFSVIRPLVISPLGRTVLALYQDHNPHERRVVSPARTYSVYVAGLRLTVEGLAWQQQDTGVAACATIGLWTMFHSSSFDDHHAIPTTAEITSSAQLFGRRPFPSTGLTVEQILEAIHKQNLNPIAVSGDIGEPNGFGKPFSRQRFANNAAAFIRSGYPILIVGHYENSGGHAICGVGFREKGLKRADADDPAKVVMADGEIEYFYIHDDNIGPNIRFRLESVAGDNSAAVLVSSAPEYVDNGEPSPEVKFFPHMIIAATHQDVRVTADELYVKGLERCSQLHNFLDFVYRANESVAPSLAFSPRFIVLRDYFKEELRNVVPDGVVLSRVRRRLQEQAPPMSLHVGVIRIALQSGTVIMDLIYDTTDSGYCMPAFVAVIFDEQLVQWLKSTNYQALGFPEYMIEGY